MGIRFLSMTAGAALALAACGGSQEQGQVPVDSPLTQFEAPESVPGDEGDDDWFADDAFDELDDTDGEGEGDEPEGNDEGEDDAEPAASKPAASEDAEKDAAGASGRAGQAKADDAREARSESGS
jgi:hypothetical protein